MGFHFKKYSFIFFLFILISCEQTFEGDLENAQVSTTGSTLIPNGPKNILSSELINWNGLNFEYAYREEADYWSTGRHVFICKDNIPNDTLKFNLNPVSYKVEKGYYMWVSIEGKVNKYPGINYNLSSQGQIKAYYHQINDKEGEILFFDFMYATVRTPDPYPFKRFTNGRFIIPR